MADGLNDNFITEYSDITRGFNFIVMEQLPRETSGKLIRKVGVLEYKGALKPGLS